MKKLVNIWHYVSVYLAGFSALIALFAPIDPVQKCLLASITILFLHFFEEFGYPGGFPLMGMKVMMNSDEMDSTKWDVNNLSSMFGNWGFLFLLYILPLIFPNVRFLTLSAMMFLFAEVLMHLVLFPVALKTFYNAGQITAVLGLGFIGCYYFTTEFNPAMFVWYDYVLAVVWFVAVFMFCFRSKLYWNLGKKDGYALTDVTAYGAGFIWMMTIQRETGQFKGKQVRPKTDRQSTIQRETVSATPCGKRCSAALALPERRV